MSEGKPPRMIRRILVALDASPHSLAGLEAARDLAIRLNAELLGLFVEDINLLRLADLPFSQEVGHFSARRRPVSKRLLETQLKAQAEWARRSLARTAEAANLKWDFLVVRGSIPSELIAATQNTDLIILGKTGWSGFSVGSTTQAILTQASKLTLILQAKVMLGTAVMVIYDGSETAGEALSLAIELAQSRQDRLIVLLIAADRAAAGEFREGIEQQLAGGEVEITYQWIKEAHAYLICNIARTEDSGILIIPKDSPSLNEETVVKILNEIDCPVLFVREPRSE